MKASEPQVSRQALKVPGVDIGPMKELATRLGLRFIEAVPESALDPDLVRSVPVEWARQKCLLPVRLDGEVSVLTSDPSNVTDPEYLALLLGVALKPVVAPADEIARSIERCYVNREDSPHDYIRDQQQGDVGAWRSGNRTSVRSEDLLQTTEKAPVTQFVNLILLSAVKRDASDIHFEPFESRLRIRYRIDGVLYEQPSPPKDIEEALVSRLKIMARMDIAEKRLPQDGMARVRVGEREIDIRVSTVPVAEGERVVLRLLNRDSALLPLGDLGIAPDMFRQFQALLVHTHGIIVVCGPTGSGKTTTLYAALGQMDAARRNILTIEDPIEYQLPNIGQIQVKPKIGLSFSTGLRHILRQDPDIVLVGEIRDLETAEIAVRASLTGHLVFTTLHTNDAPGAILRLIDMGVESYLLASSLRGVLAQRLVRRLCDPCAGRRPAMEADVVRARQEGSRLRGNFLRVPAGCERCLEGYKGRTGIFEFLTVSPAIQELVRSGVAQADASVLRTAAEQAGMRSLFADGIDKVLAGVTTLDEIVSVAG